MIEYVARSGPPEAVNCPATNAFTDDADGEYHQHRLEGARTNGGKQ